jgi:ADP-ribose pyrophosphatase YjhB (NUDIX family)
MSPQFYSEYPKFLVAVDCIIFGFSDGELNLLLLKRNMEPAKGCWSLPGGFVKEHESAEEAATRVLFTLTGLNQLYMEQLRVFSEENRDPGERVMSVAHYALVNVEDYDRELVQKHNAYWRNINDLPSLIFDHDEMVQAALRRLRRKASTEPVGFNLLSEKFTVPQLQALYEAIYGRNIDKRNFRKKIQTMDFLEKSDEKDKSGSKRGAFLYTFNQELYEKAILEGFSFTL